MSAVSEMHGTFGLNRDVSTYPGGAAAYFAMVKNIMRARWWLGHDRDHLRETFLAARALGLRTIMRVGEGGIVYVQDVLRAIEKGKGAVEIIQVGNEPQPPANATPAQIAEYWWQHAFYLNAIIEQCGPAAYQAGIRLCTPGHRDGSPVWNAKAPLGTLDYRLIEVYRKYALIGFHAYDPSALVNPDPKGKQPSLDRLDAWLGVFPQEFVVSEQGIPYKFVGGVKTKEEGDLIKADRVLVWNKALARRKRVIVACNFISIGATNDWLSFVDGGYDAKGQNSYVWTLAAHARLGAAVEQLAAG